MELMGWNLWDDENMNLFVEIFLYFGIISFYFFLFFFLFFFFVFLSAALSCCRRRRKTIGFFHPYCNDGGGGERVLWSAIRGVQMLDGELEVVIYTGGDKSQEQQILRKVKSHFGIKLLRDVKFIYLRSVFLLEDKYYPIFTIAGQSFAALIVGVEALLRHKPDLFFDSMGYAFTYPIFKWIGRCPVGSYTHYPTISRDMLQRVQERRPTYNNREKISSSASLSFVKLWYYRLFAKLYGFMGRRADVVMVNSTWTLGHVEAIWNRDDVSIVYPPCNTSDLIHFGVKERERIIVSIGQFRPEKDHILQLLSFNQLLENYPDVKDTKLVFIGSCRNDGDQQRINELQKLQKTLNLSEEQVIYEINASYQTLLNWLERGSVGIHTMWCEHFGIGVVEFMAAGLIPVAHNSGGPKMDIVIHDTGYLAKDPKEYGEALHVALVGHSSSQDEEQRRLRCREAAKRFTEEEFIRTFNLALRPLLS